MRYFNYYLLMLFVTINSYAQNMVLNPSFEDVNESELSCNYYNTTSFNNSMVNWKTKFGTTDIYNTAIDINCVMHPNNSSAASYGFQNPNIGNSYVGIAIGVNNTPARESIQGELSEPLEAGKTYLIKFYVSLADKRSYAINNFGIKFLTSDYTGNISDITADAYSTEIVTDKIGWTELEMEFTPEIDGHTHFIIGNFFPNNENEIIQLDENPWIENSTYYFIDDVSIVENKDVSTSDIDNQEFTIYPNPLQSQLNIIEKSIIKSITITDINGKKIFESIINEHETTINIEFLNSGTYLLYIHTPNKTHVHKITKS